jgi:hypothetical protein
MKMISEKGGWTETKKSDNEGGQENLLFFKIRREFTIGVMKIG